MALTTPSKGAGATLFVAASNASARSIARADFVCTGSGDQATIGSAIAALPAGGGSIQFSEGLFSHSAHYSIVNSNIKFKGMGTATIFQCTTSDFIFSHSGTAFGNISFEDMLFIGTVNQTVSVPTQARTTSGVGATIAIWMDGSLDSANSTTVITNFAIKNCYFRNLSSLPIRLFGITGVTRVESCEFTNTKDAGFAFNQEVICSNNHSYMSADNGFSISRSNNKITCTGNTVELACYDGIWLSGFIVASTPADEGPQVFSCTGNTIKNVGQSGIRLYDAPKYGTISGNFIDQGYNRGPVDGLTDIVCNGISVRGYPSTSPASPTDFAQGLTISNNTIRRTPRAGVYLNGCKGVKVVDNLILDPGTQFYADGTTLVGTNLAGMANPQNIGIFIDQPATIADIYLENNTVIDQRGTPYGLAAIYPFPPISGVTMNGGNVQNGLQLGPKLPTLLRSDTLGVTTAGSETMPRWAATNLANITMGNGTLRLAYLRARKNETVSQISVNSGSTAAGATPTLVKFALYSIDASGNLTLLAATASDTTIFAATLTQYTRSLTAAQTLIEGQRYAIGVLVMTAAAAPSITGAQSVSAAAMALDPQLCANFTGQTDIPASIAVGSLATTQSFLYAQVL